MNCPKCGGKNIVKRPYQTNDNEIIRHRRCLECGRDFYTVEYEVECTPKLRSEMSAAYSVASVKYRQNRKEKLLKENKL